MAEQIGGVADDDGAVGGYVRCAAERGQSSAGASPSHAEEIYPQTGQTEIEQELTEETEKAQNLFSVFSVASCSESPMDDAAGAMRVELPGSSAVGYHYAHARTSLACRFSGDGHSCELAGSDDAAGRRQAAEYFAADRR
jgi:hypothetical protein